MENYIYFIAFSFFTLILLIKKVINHGVERIRRFCLISMRMCINGNARSFEKSWFGITLVKICL